MKKSIFSLAIALVLISSAFANRPDAITERAAMSFQRDFHQASDVSWDQMNNYVRATFKMDKQTMFAYYDNQGNLMGLVRHILTTSLPAGLQKDIKKQYAGYWVSELFEITNDDGTSYYVQLKNADETILLKAEGTSEWSRFSLPKTNTVNP
jgi:hypothetical protein